jgi:hypothetical protein
MQGAKHTRPVPELANNGLPFRVGADLPDHMSVQATGGLPRGLQRRSGRVSTCCHHASMNCIHTITLSDGQVDVLAETEGGACLVDGHGYYRCGLAHEHPGRHVALADVCALEVEPIACTSWLWWNDSGGHELTVGPGCDHCALPAGHPQGSGCTDPVRASCRLPVRITEIERDRLEDLPDAAHCVEAERLLCELAPGHGDRHCTLGQSQDHAPDNATNWWIVWQAADARDYRIVVASDCPTVSPHDDQDLCLFIEGHQGRHSFG